MTSPALANSGLSRRPIRRRRRNLHAPRARTCRPPPRGSRGERNRCRSQRRACESSCAGSVARVRNRPALLRDFERVPLREERLDLVRSLLFPPSLLSVSDQRRWARLGALAEGATDVRRGLACHISRALGARCGLLERRRRRRIRTLVRRSRILAASSWGSRATRRRGLRGSRLIGSLKFRRRSKIWTV